MSKSADRYKGDYKQQLKVIKDLELQEDLGIASQLIHFPEIETFTLDEFFDSQELKQFRNDAE
ncbi:MAG: hypothetical protein ACO3UU_06515 [Minisyncoccia bacterium]